MKFSMYLTQDIAMQQEVDFNDPSLDIANGATLYSHTVGQLSTTRTTLPGCWPFSKKGFFFIFVF